jgi:hypothetical protein
MPHTCLCTPAAALIGAVIVLSILYIAFIRWRSSASSSDTQPHQPGVLAAARAASDIEELGARVAALEKRMSAVDGALLMQKNSMLVT